MGNMVKENMKLALEAFFETSEQKANRVLEAEDTIDYLCDGISVTLSSSGAMTYLRKISGSWEAFIMC